MFPTCYSTDCRNLNQSEPFSEESEDQIKFNQQDTNLTVHLRTVSAQWNLTVRRVSTHDKEEREKSEWIVDNQIK